MKNYERVLELKVFNLEDLCGLTGNINTSKSLVRNLLKDNKIKRIKHNLYAACDLLDGTVIPDRYMIASKIKEDGYLSYHSALQYYGACNQAFYAVYVSSSMRFENIEFDGITYMFQKSKYDFGIVNHGDIKVTDKERTVLDILSNTGLAGGCEELFSSLELIGKLDDSKILQYLKKYNSKILYSKAGYVFERFKDSLGISDKTIKECLKHISRGISYFDRDTKKMKNKYMSKWHLVVPEIN